MCRGLAIMIVTFFLAGAVFAQNTFAARCASSHCQAKVEGKGQDGSANAGRY
jgi:hypothetical protein